MNRRTLRKYASIYLKQGLFSLLLFLFAVFLALTSSWRYSLFPEKVTSISQLAEKDFAKEHPVVQLQCDTLYYTGYNNKDKAISGRYYYTTNKNHLLYILLDEESSQNKDVIQNYSGTVRLIEDNNLYHALTTQLAEELTWSFDSLSRLSIPFLASQPDYHHGTALAFAIVLAVCGLIFLLSFIFNMLHYRHCKQQALRKMHHHSTHINFIS